MSPRLPLTFRERIRLAAALGDRKPARRVTQRDPQADVAAALKMTECVQEAKALQEAGKIREARAALEQAERWRVKAGIE